MEYKEVKNIVVTGTREGEPIRLEKKVRFASLKRWQKLARYKRAVFEEQDFFTRDAMVMKIVMVDETRFDHLANNLLNLWICRRIGGTTASHSRVLEVVCLEKAERFYLSIEDYGYARYIGFTSQGLTRKRKDTYENYKLGVEYEESKKRGYYTGIPPAHLIGGYRKAPDVYLKKEITESETKKRKTLPIPSSCTRFQKPKNPYPSVA